MDIDGKMEVLGDTGDKGRCMLSLVIPTYNERGNIGILIKRVYGVLEEIGLLFEVMIVDDDSLGNYGLNANVTGDQPVSFGRRKGMMPWSSYGD